MRIPSQRKALLSLVAFTIAAGSAPLAAQRGGPPPCDPAASGLKLPAGFCAIVVAEGVRGARQLLVAPNGNVLVAAQGGRGGGGGAVLLRDTNGDGRADVNQALGTAGGNGIALTPEYLYVAPNDAVLRYHYKAGALQVTGAPDTIVQDLPNRPGHVTKTIVLTSNGNLFVNVGSPSNSCQRADRTNNAPGKDPCDELATRAGIWRFSASRLHQTQKDGEHFATGLRNVVGMALLPGTNELFAMQHGRDQLFENWGDKGYTARDGADKPAEEFVHALKGDNFGWPYCYFDPDAGHLVLAPEYGGDTHTVGRCASMKEPLVAFPGHWAPDGLVFYTGTQFPASYRGGAFIAFHGSWNRGPRPEDQQGFQVVFQPMSGQTPAGKWSTFADGFRDLQPGSRPVGLAVGPDGSLYVGDDTGGRIWRIIHR